MGSRVVQIRTMTVLCAAKARSPLAHRTDLVEDKGTTAQVQCRPIKRKQRLTVGTIQWRASLPAPGAGPDRQGGK